MYIYEKVIKSILLIYSYHVLEFGKTFVHFALCGLSGLFANPSDGGALFDDHFTNKFCRGPYLAEFNAFYLYYVIFNC